MNLIEGAATVMREPGLTADQILAIGNHGQCKAIVAPNDKVTYVLQC
jgi:hypothetical protein